MNQPLELFAGAGIFAMCWRQISAFVQRLRGLFVVKSEFSGIAALAMRSYCWNHFKRVSLGDRYFGAGNWFVRPLRRYQDVGHEDLPTQAVIFMDGWKPVFASAHAQVTGSQISMGTPQNDTLTMTTLRWCHDPERMVIEALRAYNHAKVNGGGTRYFVRRVAGYSQRNRNDVQPASWPSQPPTEGTDVSRITLRFLEYSRDDLGPLNPPDPMGSFAFPKEIYEAIQHFERWKNSEEWYKTRSVPWRLGFGFKGQPGTGKTSCVRAIAQKYDMPIFQYDLATLSNEEMVNGWKQMQESVPCVALIEDIDTIFEGRVNISGEQGGGLTFDCLLNCMSGVETADGVFIVVTTNKPETLDSALTRPGRLDRIIELPTLGRVELERIGQRIVGDWPEALVKLLEEYPTATGAAFTDACVKEALKRFWEK